MGDYAVILAAAGKSSRFGDREKKPYAKVDGRPIFLRAAEAFINRDDVCQTILAVAPEDYDTVKSKYGPNLGFMGIQLVQGGQSRVATVRKALDTVQDDARYVAVHDAVRICVTQTMIDEVFAEAGKSGAAILAVPLAATLKRVSTQGVVEETVERSGLYEAQTPQVFRRDVLAKAYADVADDVDATDDAELVTRSGHAVTVVPSDSTNLKITLPGDVQLAAAILKNRPRPKPSSPRGPFEEAQW